MEIGSKCFVSGCSKVVVARGLCDTHRKRVDRHGTIEAGRPKDWGKRTSHPMYKGWHWLVRRNYPLCADWQDFHKFVADVGQSKPSDRHYIARRDESLPYSKENCYWREAQTSNKPDEYKESRREYQKKWRKANKDVARSSEFMRRYGIDVDEYNARLEKQGHVCAVCSCIEIQLDNYNNVPRRLAVDHDHKTGKARGLLCALCNRGIGAFRDDPELLRKAIAYLAKWEP